MLKFLRRGIFPFKIGYKQSIFFSLVFAFLVLVGFFYFTPVSVGAASTLKINGANYDDDFRVSLNGTVVYDGHNLDCCSNTPHEINNVGCDDIIKVELGDFCAGQVGYDSISVEYNNKTLLNQELLPFLFLSPFRYESSLSCCCDTSVDPECSSCNEYYTIIFDKTPREMGLCGLPTAPSNLVAISVSSTQINLSWADEPNNEDYFEIQRGSCDPSNPGSFSPDGFVYNTPGSNITTYNNTDLQFNTRYCYRARAHNSFGYSGFSNIAYATTFQAIKPTVQTDSATLVVNTTAQGNGRITNNGGKDCTEWGIEWRTATGSYNAINSATSKGAFIGTGAFNNVMQGLNQDTTYYYRAKARNTDSLIAVPADWGYGAEVLFKTTTQAVGSNCNKWKVSRGPISQIQGAPGWNEDWNNNTYVLQKDDGNNEWVGYIDDPHYFPCEANNYIFNSRTYFYIANQTIWPAGYVHTYDIGYQDDATSVYIENQGVYTRVYTDIAGNPLSVPASEPVTLASGWHEIVVVDFGYWPSGAWAQLGFGPDNKKLSELPEVIRLSPSKNLDCACVSSGPEICCDRIDNNCDDKIDCQDEIACPIGTPSGQYDKSTGLCLDSSCSNDNGLWTYSSGRKCGMDAISEICGADKEYRCFTDPSCGEDPKCQKAVVQERDGNATCLDLNGLPSFCQRAPGPWATMTPGPQGLATGNCYNELIKKYPPLSYTCETGWGICSDISVATRKFYASCEINEFGVDWGISPRCEGLYVNTSNQYCGKTRASATASCSEGVSTKNVVNNICQGASCGTLPEQAVQDCCAYPAGNGQPAYYKCENQKCRLVYGQGANQCRLDSDCVSVLNHKTCNSKFQCIIVSGAGANGCASDTDCVSALSPRCSTAGDYWGFNCHYSNYPVGELWAYRNYYQSGCRPFSTTQCIETYASPCDAVSTDFKEAPVEEQCAFCCINGKCEGECFPGQTQSCTINGQSGQKTCKASIFVGGKTQYCGWGECKAACTPGETKPCICGGTQTCQPDGATWSNCSISVGQTKPCICGGTQTCQANGTLSSCPDKHLDCLNGICQCVDGIGEDTCVLGESCNKCGCSPSGAKICDESQTGANCTDASTCPTCPTQPKCGCSPSGAKVCDALQTGVNCTDAATCPTCPSPSNTNCGCDDWGNKVCNPLQAGINCTDAATCPTCPSPSNKNCGCDNWGNKICNTNQTGVNCTDAATCPSCPSQPKCGCSLYGAPVCNTNQTGADCIDASECPACSSQSKCGCSWYGAKICYTLGTGNNCYDADTCPDCQNQPQCTANRTCEICGGGAYCSTDANCSYQTLGCSTDCNGNKVCVPGGQNGSCASDNDCQNQPQCTSARTCEICGGGAYCSTDANCSYQTLGCSTDCNGNKVCVPGGQNGSCANNSDCGSINLPPSAEALSAGSGPYCSYALTGIPASGLSVFQWTYTDAENDPEVKSYFEISTSFGADFGNGIVYRQVSNGAANRVQIPVLLPLINPPADCGSVPESNNCGSYINFGVHYYWRVKVQEAVTGLDSGWVDYVNPNSNPDNTYLYPYLHPSPMVVYNLPVSVAPGDTAAFTDGSVCYDDDGTSYLCSASNSNTYQWWFGDGGTTGLISCSVADHAKCNTTLHTYVQNKNYTTRLQVCDDLGCCSNSKTLRVGPSNANDIPQWWEISPY